MSARKNIVINNMNIIFWSSLFFIFYAYLGYPVLLWMMTRLVHCRIFDGVLNAQDELPSVTLIISAYNEEKVIGDRITNALKLDYPKQLLQIMVVSDGSSDRTTDIVLDFAEQGIVLQHYEGRIGKTACLNRAVPLATGDIVVFSDANSTYDSNALKALVDPFCDSSVGFVTGWTQYGHSADKAATSSLGLYSGLELVTKELESRIGSCVGADGAIFAIRKELYKPLEDFDANDFVIPLTFNKQGYRGVLQKKAFCFEQDAGSAKAEFHRQVRIATMTIRAIVNHNQLLNPIKFGFFSLELFSHKLCRFLVPLCMLTLLISSLFLASSNNFYLAALLGQALFYASSSITAILPRPSRLAQLADAAKIFIVANTAIFLACIKFLQGEKYTTWSPTQR